MNMDMYDIVEDVRKAVSILYELFSQVVLHVCGYISLSV